MTRHSATPEAVARAGVATRCYQRALMSLARLHPDEFDQLLAEERTSEGLPAERTRRRSRTRRVA